MSDEDRKLEIGILRGDTGKITQALASGANVNAKSSTPPLGYTPLHTAAIASTPAIVQLLIDEGADIDACNASDQTPLMLAKDSGRVDIAEVLKNAKSKQGRHLGRLEQKRQNDQDDSLPPH